MIMNSFLFLQGIGRRGESKLWNKGIRNWDDFLRAKSIAGISSARKAYYDRKIIEARKNLFSLNSSYFYDKLPASEQWRLYEFFKEDAVFLDIETTGLSDNAQVTVVGLFDGIDTKTMIRNINFDEGILKNEILKYKLVVTFNGASFDIPFLSKRYQNLVPRIPHFDLRFACSRIGLKGGLKTIERKLGIERQNNIVRELRGGDAIELMSIVIREMTIQDYDEVFPIEATWKDAVYPYTKNEQLLECPASRLGRDSYEMFPPLSGLGLSYIPAPAETPMVYDAGFLKGGKAPHSEGFNVTFSDGHCKAVGSSEASRYQTSSTP